MKKFYRFFLFAGLLSFGLSNCSTTHRTVYVPIRETVYVPAGTTNPSPPPKTETENWSVITDPVVLDEGGNVVNEPASPEAGDAYYIPFDSDEYSEFALSEPSLPPVDPPPVRIVDYYYDTYYPVSYTTYRYYPHRQSTWWYYSDWNNDSFYYPSYPYYPLYSDPWWSPHYGSSIYVRDNYAGLGLYYSDYGRYGRYGSYGLYSFWSPLDYYNPYWSYGWGDYWDRYYPAPYLSHYGYYPYSHWGYPMYGWYDWRYRDWYYDRHRDRDRDGREDNSEIEKRETRPMFGDRRDQIRLTSSDSDGNASLGGDASLSGRLTRLPSKSDTRRERLSESERDSRQSIPRQNQPLIGEWSLPPLRSPKKTGTENPYFTRDDKNGKTIRTSRDPKTSNDSNLIPSTSLESPRDANPRPWTSDSPNSRVSIWRQGRVVTPNSTSTGGSNIPNDPSIPSTMPNRQIRILPGQNNRRNELMTSSHPQSGDTIPTQTRSTRIPNPIRTYSPNNANRQNSTADSQRTFLSPTRESTNQPISAPRMVSPQRSNVQAESYSTQPSRSYQLSPRESYNRVYSPRIESERSSSGGSFNRSPSMNSSPRGGMNSSGSSYNPGNFSGGDRSMSSSPSFSPSRSPASAPARSEAPSRPTSNRR